MAETKMMPLRLDDEDRTKMDDLRTHLGISTYADLVRHLIRKEHRAIPRRKTPEKIPEKSREGA
jgi:hypothetical protein